ncbi:MAG: T9SS type A sorting domain-containing protein [Candidatus Cloacimonadota bacterium]|nr:T9SS type A sorting domain-containing protein [Candidatus Cloacimonadota bacterium]
MKKKGLTILAISVIMFLGISATLIAQNMVTNGDLESWTGGNPDNWNHVENIAQESTNIHGGTYSAAHQSASGTKDFGHEYIAGIIAGHDYNLSYYFLDNDDQARTRLWSKWKDDAGSTVGSTISTEYSTDNAEWQHYNNTITAPDGATQFYLEVRVYKESSGAYGGSVYYDDFSFEDAGGATPTITNAYALSATAVDVLYNIDLTAVASADYTLTGTATITFSSATIDGTNAKLVHLTGASANMIGDITLDNIYDAENDTDYDFYAGITPIALTNTLNPDDHIVNGEFATFQGIVSANDEYNNVWVSDDSGPYNGILIYDYDFDGLVAVGDEILFIAKRDEYNNLTELKDPILISTISTGNLPYSPADISGSDIGNTIAANTNPAEQWEGQLVVINNVLVAASPVNKDDLYIGSDDSWATTFVIGDEVDYQYENIGPILDDAIASGEPIDIKGVVDWNYSNEYYRINPRSAADLPVEDYPHTTNSFALYQNYPNPFSASTTISFNLATDLHPSSAVAMLRRVDRLTQIKIYNIKGQIVKQLKIENLKLKINEVVWDGKDESRKQVPNGIYFCRLSWGDKSAVKKMLLLK